MALEDNEFAGLSAQEIAAIQDNEGSEEAEALKEIAAGSDDDAKDVASGDAAKDSDANDEDDDDTAETLNTKTFVPTQAVVSVEDFDNKIAELKTAKSDLRTQLNNGDIDLETYEVQKDAIVDQEIALNIQQANAINAAQQNDFVAKQIWQKQQETFFQAKQNAIYGDDIISAALNAAVIKLASDPKYADEDGMFFLNEADKIVRERFGIVKEAAAKDVPSRKPDLSKIPKTLGDLPNAAVDETNDGEFAYLEKLEGMDYENAVAKISLSPEKLERFTRL